jgi:PAS domain-containing protein
MNLCTILLPSESSIVFGVFIFGAAMGALLESFKRAIFKRQLQQKFLDDLALAPMFFPSPLNLKGSEFDGSMPGNCVARIDQGRRYVEVNEDFCRLLHYSRSELIGRRVDDVTLPSSVEPEHLGRVIRRVGDLRGLYGFQTSLGNPLFVSFHAIYLQDESILTSVRPVST